MPRHMEREGRRNLCTGAQNRIWESSFKPFKLADNGDGDSAFHALSEQLTAVAVNAADGAGGVVGVRRTAAGAVELCPAVTAFGARVDVAGGEILLNGGVFHAVPDVAEEEFFVPDELVAG